MGRAHLLCLSAFFVALLAAGCSGDSSGCKYDVDCPGTQRCLDGVCKYPGQTQDCEELTCEADEVCVQGACIAADTDADSDGWSVAVDCDDGDAQVHPEALETCNEVDDDCDGATDEDLFCGEDCIPVAEPPAVQAPAACDASTLCDTCYLYQSTTYYCRELGYAAYAWLAIPQMTPCDSGHHCQLMRCEDLREWHCDAAVGVFVAGGVPTAESDTCNNADDNCDGLTDEPGAEQFCDERENADAVCMAGSCQYGCRAGFHACADLCLDDASTNSCGARCTPCLPPDNGEAICVDGNCDFQCQPGHLRQGQACIACDTDQACGLGCSPCPAGTSCCGDDCYNLNLDPEHCGGCELMCADLADTCCQGQGCCAAAYPQCCGQSCCDGIDQCCPGDYCCDPGGSCCTDHCCTVDNPNCCGDGCCGGSDSCCNGTMCCPPSHPNCCPDGCCPAGSGVCCGPGCCPDGTSCCNDQFCCEPGGGCCADGCCPAASPICCGGGCCPSNFPVCCAAVCCPAGTTCCNGGASCCARGPSGKLIPLSNSPKPQPKKIH